jgi:D-serine deaminase-like pyridoxal phosphate-dependent protein
VPADASPPLDEGLARSHGGGAALGRLGEPGSRALLPTPSLVCDVDVLIANIARMAERARAAGVALRPHAKTHKSAFVAGLQLDHGAAGISCAKVAEAEALVARLAADGRDRCAVLLTSPPCGPAAAARVVSLSGACDLMVAVDHPDGVDELAVAVTAADGVAGVDGVDGVAGGSLAVLCDVDLGMGRTGVTGPDGARAVARAIASAPGLRFAGVQAYGGHLQHIHGRDERSAATAEAMERLTVVIDALEADGHRVALRTGGGTGTAVLDMGSGVLNELQVGSYVFMDREYRDALGDDPEGGFGHSLTVATTVVSVNQPSFVTVDAGLKSMATEAGPPTVVGPDTDVSYHFFGDEHGLVTRGAGRPFTRGERLDLVPPHCDPTVDRYDVLWLVRGDTVVGVTAVDARGCAW